MKEKRLEIEKRKTEKDLLDLKNEILGINPKSDQSASQVDQQQKSQETENQPKSEEAQPQTQSETQQAQQAEENGKENLDQNSAVT